MDRVVSQRPWIDRARDGASPADQRALGRELAIWLELGACALGALNAGWSRPTWEAEVLDPRSRLGQQVRVSDRRKLRTERAVARALDSAWQRAEKKAAKSPRWDTETARAEAEQRAQRLRAIVADPNVPLSQTQRTLLDHIALKAQQSGSTVVNVPRAATVHATGLGERAVRYNLDRLSDLGLLALVERGRPRGANAKTPARANAYRLPDAEAIDTYLSRETRQVGPQALTGGTHATDPSGTPSLTGGTQSTEIPTEENMDEALILTHAEVVTVLGEAALARLLEGRRAKQCELPRPHTAHEFGPMTEGGRLAHRCEGAAQGTRHLHAVGNEKDSE